jgi:hypothetical protein
MLPREVRNQNRWITENLNGLEWSDGTVPLWKMKEIFTSNIAPGSIVYVKGREKCQLLKWKLPAQRYVFNLEDLGCPPAERIDFTIMKCMNPHYCLASNERNRCAQYKCIRYMNWFYKDYLRPLTVQTSSDDDDIASSSLPI